MITTTAKIVMASRGGLGRVPAPPVPLPDVALTAQAVTEWLHQHEGAQRRPEQTGRVLALVVLLHRAGRPWPTRHQVRDHLDVSLPMIDTVIAQRQALGDIEVTVEVTPGNIKRRPSIIRVKYLVPSAELLDAVTRAEKRLRRSKK